MLEIFCARNKWASGKAGCGYEFESGGHGPLPIITAVCEQELLIVSHVQCFTLCYSSIILVSSGKAWAHF